MADTIYIKSGDLNGRSEMPKLRYDKEKGSEIAYQKEEKALYVGTPNGNVKLCDAEMEQRLKAYIDGLVSEINTRLEGMTPSE